jgi:hypothetical protein
VAVERVAKDLSGLSAEERLAAVQQDAPELLQLIAELREGITEVRSRVGPLLQEVRRRWRVSASVYVWVGGVRPTGGSSGC